MSVHFESDIVSMIDNNEILKSAYDKLTRKTKSSMLNVVVNTLKTREEYTKTMMALETLVKNANMTIERNFEFNELPEVLYGTDT